MDVVDGWMILNLVDSACCGGRLTGPGELSLSRELERGTKKDLRFKGERN